MTASYFYFFGWRDALEICSLSAFCYYFFLWLKVDKQKNLFPPFFYYWVTLIFASFLQLNTLFLVLLVASPIALMLFIIMHQTTLQRNFITLSHSTNYLPERKNSDWLEITIRSLLYGINKNKNIYCIIVQKDTLHSLLTPQVHLQAPLQLDLLTMLIDTPTFDETKYIIIDAQGNLMGINGVLHYQKDAVWLNEDIKNCSQWQQEHIILTSKTDAITLCAQAATRDFTIITKGRMIQNLDAKNTLRIIKKYVMQHTETLLVEKKDVHGSEVKKNTPEQYIS